MQRWTATLHLDSIATRTMKKIILASTAVLVLTVVHGQNLVPNPSFEDTIQCPVGVSQINYTTSWYSPTWSTPDYFNSCNNSVVGIPQNFEGWENAKSGAAYSGIITYRIQTPANYREYIQAQLTDTLIAGAKYNVSFYVSLADSARFTCNDIGAYFSPSAFNISTNFSLPYIPQIANNALSNPLTNKNGWTLVADTLTALGGEVFITIGNFNNDVNSDTVFVGGGNSGNPSYPVAYYYIDNVSVYAIDSIPIGINEKGNNLLVTIFPNPFSVQTTLRTAEQLKNATLTVDNCFGQTVAQIKNISGQTITFFRDNLASGLYFVRLTEENKTIAVDKLVIADK